MKRQCACFLLLLFLFTLSAFAQLPMLAFSGGGGGSRDGSFQGNATFRLPLPSPPVLVNAPYAGEQVNETSQTLADGTHITRKGGMGQKSWRDSQGRVRIERAFLAGGVPTTIKNVPTLVQISDPQAGYIYIMDDVTRVAHRIAYTPGPQRQPNAAMARQTAAMSGRGSAGAPTVIPGGPPMTTVAGVLGASRGGSTGSVQPQGRANPVARDSTTMPQSTVQDLGTQMIEGVECHGTRTTIVYPPGGMQGNDGPITTTREEWRSLTLQLSVLTVNFNPASGTSTATIANLTTSEPDPALFFVPAGYTIVDETDTFTIKWGEN
jgi:hypothetical protein